MIATEIAGIDEMRGETKGTSCYSSLAKGASGSGGRREMPKCPTSPIPILDGPAVPELYRLSFTPILDIIYSI